MTPETLYLQLGHLVAEMPDLNMRGAVTAEVNRWLGRAYALVQLGDGTDAMLFKIASQGLGGATGAHNAQTVAAIVHRALAVAELSAPAAIQGSFIQAGMGFDAFLAVGKVFETAQTKVLMVDPYADSKILEYALQASTGIAIHVLADEGHQKPSLLPAVERWISQYGADRPLEVRLTPKRTLHDRALIVDSRTVWTVGQSFNALAARAHTTISRVNEPDAVQMKLDAYESLWTEAAPAELAKKSLDGR